MRARALFLVFGLLVGSSVACSSALQQPDGGGGSAGTGGATGGAGTTGAAGTSSGGGGCVVADCHFDAGAVCSMDQAYSYGDTGGLVAREDTTALGPSLAYTRTRTSHLDAGTMTCAPMLPGCDDDSGAAVDVTRIMNDINDADVQAALAMSKPPLYGHDLRPVDGSVFQFLRVGDGAGFLVGVPCTTSGGCVDAPAGVTRLVADLRALDAQQLMDASCAALR